MCLKKEKKRSPKNKALKEIKRLIHFYEYNDEYVCDDLRNIEELVSNIKEK